MSKYLALSEVQTSQVIFLFEVTKLHISYFDEKSGIVSL